LDSGQLRDADREELGRGFVDQCLEQRYQARWAGLVEHLMRRGAPLSGMPAAVAILRHGLGGDRSGRMFRHQIYQWSRREGLPESFASVLVIACGAMSFTHPDEALVRLHHIARRNRRRVRAADALVDLVRADPRLLRLLLTRLTDGDPATAWAADPGIFMSIADASSHFTGRSSGWQPLITQRQVARQLTAGWTLVFTRLTDADWHDRARDWLDRAAADEANRRALVNVLVEGARPVPAVLPPLYGLAHRAAFRDAIAPVVLAKISAIQGVELP
jgi:hypothetical protein